MRSMVLNIFHFVFWFEGKCIFLPVYWFGMTCFVRLLGVPCLHCINDRHIEQLRLLHSHLSPSFSGFQLAEMAAYIACVTFISLGYFIGIKKSCLISSVAVKFLGYICNSKKQAYLLLQEKRLRGDISMS